MDAIIKEGRYVFAVAITALGVEHLICAWLRLFENKVFAGQMVDSVIPWVPAHAWLAYLMGLFMIASGVAILANIWARTAALALGVVFLICVLAHVNSIYVARTVSFEMLALGSSALMLAGTLTMHHDQVHRWSSAISTLTGSARYLFAASSIVFGIDHFLFLSFVASLIPWWIPWRLFWAAFTGAGFVATGVALIVAGASHATRPLARLASFLLGTMFALWFIVLHAPRTLGIEAVPGKIAPRDPNEWSSAFIALAMCGGSWICAQALTARVQKAKPLYPGLAAVSDREPAA